MSRQDWVGEAAAKVLAGIDEEIRRRVRQFEPVLIFLGGSAVHGELCGIEDAKGGRTVLSDLDLGVVTRIRIPLEARERIGSELVEITADGPIARTGFYFVDDLGRHSPTLGLVETTRRGVVLGGDPSLLTRFQMPEPESIPEWEARRLLANRVIEWAVSMEPGKPFWARVYAAAKLHADQAAVHLIARRAFKGGGYEHRSAAIGDLGFDKSTRNLIEEWTAWRLRPQWNETPVRVDVEASADSPVLAAEVVEAVGMTLRALSRDGTVSDLLTSSDVRGRAWARSWKRWVGLYPSVLRRVGPREIARSPRVILWEAAIEWALGHCRPSAALLERLTGIRVESHGEIRSEIVRLAGIMDREWVD